MGVTLKISAQLQLVSLLIQTYTYWNILEVTSKYSVKLGTITPFSNFIANKILETASLKY